MTCHRCVGVRVLTRFPGSARVQLSSKMLLCMHGEYACSGIVICLIAVIITTGQDLLSLRLAKGSAVCCHADFLTVSNESRVRRQMFLPTQTAMSCRLKDYGYRRQKCFQKILEEKIRERGLFGQPH